MEESTSFEEKCILNNNSPKSVKRNKYRNPICWDIDGLRQLEGLDLIQETVDKVQVVKKCLKAA